jgi:hypothetical protein
MVTPPPHCHPLASARMRTMVTMVVRNEKAQIRP